MVARHCSDRRLQKELLLQLETIPTVSQQLNVVAAVKASSGRRDAEKQVEVCTNNLIKCIQRALKCAESCSLRWMSEPSDILATSIPKGVLQKVAYQQSAFQSVRFKRKIYRPKITSQN